MSHNNENSRNRFIPHPFPKFHSYTQYTPTMPKFYDDVYSQEQTIKGICLEIDKIINYLNSIADTINWQYEEMERIEKKCDELLEKCEELLAKVEEEIAAIKKELAEFEERIEQEIEDTKKWLIEEVQKIKDDLDSQFAELKEQIFEKFDGLEEEIRQFMEDVKDRIAEYVEEAIEKYITSEKVAEIIKKVIDEHWQEWVEQLEMITDEDIEELFENIPEYLEVTLLSLTAIFYEENGRVELPTINKLRENETLKFKVKAIDGYTLESVVDSDGNVLTPDSSGVYSVVVTKNITITANTSAITKRISFVSDPVGVNNFYNEDGTQIGDYVDVPVNSEFKFSVSTETEYALTDVIDNKGRTYTKQEGLFVIDVTEDLTITANATSIYRFVNLTTDNPYVKYFAEDGTTELPEANRVLRTDSFKFKAVASLPRVLTKVVDDEGTEYKAVDGVYTIEPGASNLNISCETYIQQFDVNLLYDGVGVVKYFTEDGTAELTSPVKVDCYSSLKTKIMAQTDHYITQVIDSRTGAVVEPIDNVYTFENVAEDFNITASSDSIYRQVKLNVAGVGAVKITYDGEEVSDSFNVEKGTEVELTIVAATDHYIKSVIDERTGSIITPTGTNTYNLGAVNENFTLTINSDSAFRDITFNADHATFTTEDGEEIESVPVELGSTYKFKIVNDYGFTIKSVIDNQGRLYEADTSGVYTSYEITDNVTIVATSELYKLPLGFTFDTKIACNPAQIFGYGVWEEDTTGRIRRPAGNTETGGSDEVSLTSSQNGRHFHDKWYDTSGNFWLLGGNQAGMQTGGSVAYAQFVGDSSLSGGHSSYSGEGQSHSNMQAYQNCFSYTLLRYS